MCLYDRVSSIMPRAGGRRAGAVRDECCMRTPLSRLQPTEVQSDMPAHNGGVASSANGADTGAHGRGSKPAIGVVCVNNPSLLRRWTFDVVSRRCPSISRRWATRARASLRFSAREITAG